MTAAEFKRDYFMTAPQAALLMRAYEHPKGNYEHKANDRQASFDALKEREFVAEANDLSPNEIAEATLMMRKLVIEAHTLTASFEKWHEAKKKLEEVGVLNNRNGKKVWRLTEKGKKMGEQLAQANLTYSVLRFMV